MAARHHLAYIARAAALSAVLAVPCAAAPQAFAAETAQLNATYQAAEIEYRSAIVDQVQNGSKMVAVESEIQVADSAFVKSRKYFSEVATTLYKGERHRSDIMDMVLDSASLSEAIARYNSYVRVENYYENVLSAAKSERDALTDKRQFLIEEKARIRAKITDALAEVEEAEAAVLEADHSDGAYYHQAQGNDANCGATSFIVGVNILLHENLYTDNVAVWNGPGFGGDSTSDLAFKAQNWLIANDFADQIEVHEIPGDIHFAQQLAAELENGNVVVLSSGPGSIWQRADGSSVGPGAFPDGHWMVFYDHEDGMFYGNDSSVSAEQGAGCAFSTLQMQQWLDGRGNHFAVRMSKVSLFGDA